MTEKLLQYIWQHSYYNSTNLCTTAGEAVQVIYSGTINTNQGPDFLQARVRVGATLFVGSVEIHLRTSGWKKHGHSLDPNYNTVILHVVYEHDDDGGTLPVLVLGSRIPRLLLDRYAQLMQATHSFPCAHLARTVSSLVWTSWKDRLLVERVERKARRVLALLEKSNRHWEEAFWWLLARSFGGTVNGDAFEQVAMSVPVVLLGKHKSSIHQLEAMLFGQANLLRGKKEDDYALLLQREYGFLKSKYGLQPISLPVHFLRMRPPNFPTVRLAQLAALVHTSDHLFSRMLDAESAADLKKLFTVTANDYWLYRYRFDEPSAYAPKVVGAAMFNLMLTNLVAPVLFAYGCYHGEPRLKMRSVQLLEQSPAEQNRITSIYQRAGLAITNGGDAQAFIELKTEYCDLRRCLHCAIGNTLFKEEIARSGDEQETA